MKFYITGSTRGLGQYLKNEFSCIPFDRPYDLNTDAEDIANLIEPNSVVILNAHASQYKYVTLLKDKAKLVIIGSIAAINKDYNRLTYSNEKEKLEQYVTNVSLHNKLPMLYLRITSSSYKNYPLISTVIQFWLDTPKITFIGFNID